MTAPVSVRARTAAALVVAAVAILAGCWIASQAVVATWLERDALQRAQRWLDGGTPWQWDFAADARVVAAGSENVELLGRDGDGAHLRVLPPAGIVSIGMRGERIDPMLAGALRVELSGDPSAKVTALAMRGTTHTRWAATTSPQIGAVTLPLTDVGDAPIDGLHLWIDTEQPAEVRLRTLDVLPERVLAPAECATRDTLDATLAACGPRLARFTAPPSATTDRLLWWRDALLAQRPGAVVTAALGGVSLASRIPAALPTLWPWLLFAAACATCLIAAVLRRRSASASASSRGRAFGELLLVSCVPVAALASGIPGDDVPPLAAATFALALLTAVLLPDPDPMRPDAGWQVVGDAQARRAAFVFTLVAGGLVLAVGLWLADGGHARSLDPDRLWRYPLWAALQQWLLLRTIAPRTRQLTNSPALGAVLAGGAFALLHLPNFGLMVATFAGGTAWAWLGDRHRALLPLVLSHALLGLLLVGNLPPWLLRSAEVGGRYLMAP